MAERGSPLALIDLPAALLAGALWYVRPELGILPLLLVVVGFVLRHRAEPPVEYELTALDAAVALFLLSAVMGLLIAADRSAALEKFWVILGSVAIYGALVRAPAEVSLGRRTVKPVHLLLGGLPSLIAVYYIMTADYSVQIGKLSLLDGFFGWLSSWQPSLPGHKLHPNVAGGLIAALLPLQARVLTEWRVGATAAAPEKRGAKGLPYWIVETALLGVSVLGLVLSASRGAWISLVVVALGLVVLGKVRLGRHAARATAGAAALLLVAVVALGQAPSTAPQSGFAQDAAAPGAVALQAADLRAVALRAVALRAVALRAVALRAVALRAVADGTTIMGSAQGRLTLWANSLGLARDTAFTGLGLGGFQMAYSTYVLLLHVGHTSHSHNLLLDVWLELGLLGLASFAWLLAAAVVAWRRVQRLGDARGRVWANAALAAIAVFVLHGLVDDPLFGSRGGTLLLLVPFSLLNRVQADAVWAAGEPPTLTQVLRSRNGVAAAGLLVVALLIGLLLPVRSQVQANLGALAQTRAELSVYEWPAWPIQDALRRGPGAGLGAEINLAPAISHYEMALALNPGNATANRRLGQILLSRGDYPAAGPRLAAAHHNDYTNRAATQLYGEWLAIIGRTEEAAALWRTIDLSQGQIAGRVWWYENIGEPENAAAVAAAAR